MKIRALFIAYAACLLSANANAADQVLTFTGLGPVQIGMTVGDAEKALGATLKPLNKADKVSREICWLTERADGGAPWLTYMVQNGKIVRIDVWQTKNGVPPVATTAGVKLGTSEQTILEKYGSSLQAAPNSNLAPNGFHATVLSADGKYGLVFATGYGELVSMRGGLLDAIGLNETCL